MKNVTALLTLLLVILIAQPISAQQQVEKQRPAMIVELSPRVLTARPLLNVQRTSSMAWVAGMGRVRLQSLYDFEKDNAPLLRELTQAQLRKFGRWVRMEARTEAELDYTISALSAMGALRTAYRAPTPEPAVLGTPRPAPARIDADFTGRQGYFRAPPVGMDVEFARTKLADNDRRIVFADVEAAWNKNHFDVPLGKKGVVGLAMAPNTSWFPHGTAVVGIVAGKDNGMGITGIAPDSKVRLYSVFRRQDNRIFDNVSATILKAGQDLKKGSVLLIEVQYNNVEGAPSFVPVEFFQPEFEAIEYAISRGIVVVEVAGNGGLDLDVYLDRDGEIPDSGAIMVGGGGVPNGYNQGTVGENLRTLWFSNYGSRVNVQNWGEHVVTAGYGDLSSGPSLRNDDFTGEFNGTSAAGALTAGACVAIQKYATVTLGRPLTTAEMRDILVETGTPQLGPAHKEQIGPRPDLRAAFAAVDRLAQ